jgi:hypothetical protein
MVANFIPCSFQRSPFSIAGSGDFDKLPRRRSRNERRKYFTTKGAKDLARQSGNQSSEYLPQKRKGRQGRRLRVTIILLRVFIFLV